MMLTNCWLMKLPRTVGFTPARKAFSAGRDGEFRNGLLDTLLKTLRRATNVPTITVAHK